MDEHSNEAISREALLMHASGRPGKIEIHPTKPLTTQRDLSLAYSPGVAAPCLAIHADPDKVYDYTNKSNMVAVVSNGTAVLGLGNLGALGGKPVMEGKAVLFKRFADVDAIDLCIDTQDVDEIVNCVRFLAPSFGGINLEDIKAPECFMVEQRLRELMPIPVFHDDQHGTAIIASAGLLNGLDLTGRDIKKVKMVVNGAGASAVACVELFKKLGLPHNNVIMCDTKGVIYEGRTEGMNQWKSAHAVKTKARTLAEAAEGADILVGLSAKGAFTREMIKAMTARPLIFAMANPDPEITPEEVREVRADAIVATGRSDYPNQINNVLGFPYIFRGALDVRAKTINDEMKLAAARALAKLAREDVPDEVARAYAGRRLQFGPEYIIPAPFDPRLIWAIPSAVAKAAMDSGVAGKPIENFQAYHAQLSARLDPTAGSMQAIFETVRNNPKRVVFAEGEEEKSIRAALAFRAAGYGTPVLIGREEQVLETMRRMGLSTEEKLEVRFSRTDKNAKYYADWLYKKLQRRGYLQRDCVRMVNQDRNIFGACMVALRDADALVTGLTRNYYEALDQVTTVLDARPNERIFGLSIMIAHGRTIFLADTAVHELPQPEQLADFAVCTAQVARRFGHEPRVALISFSNFGAPDLPRSQLVRDAVGILDRRKVDFAYDGEMGVDVALNQELKQLYPFCRLSMPANVLIMPGLHSANVATKLMQNLGGGTVIGPLLMGLSRPAQILNQGATVSDIVNTAALAAHEAIRLRE